MRIFKLINMISVMGMLLYCCSIIAFEFRSHTWVVVSFLAVFLFSHLMEGFFGDSFQVHMNRNKVPNIRDK